MATWSVAGIDEVGDWVWQVGRGAQYGTEELRGPEYDDVSAGVCLSLCRESSSEDFWIVRLCGPSLGIVFFYLHPRDDRLRVQLATFLDVEGFPVAWKTARTLTLTVLMLTVER